MRRLLLINIEAEDTECGWGYDQLSRDDDDNYYCDIFGDLDYTVRSVKNGQYIRRLPQCLEAERAAKTLADRKGQS